ncbi:cytochrome ubiquinol oxidase subunit I [Demequina aurantiaca]|uniref:cytochrome ubiquinol oxidase subunit I n=1 Tax=Demequina aurantiaca TaxID=676200 RepID=UPI003D355381
MDVLDLARWQFGLTTVYHFMLVPLTIGLSTMVAIMQTAWVRTGNEKWLRLTKFFGKLLLINFALGVATGIVQEFQFGMNWSEYSRFVGDVIGGPIAMETLAAFFLESTFLGLWIFGWDRLPKKVHLATVWAFSIGSMLSAYFILAANSWMQHPVGADFNAETGYAEMTDIWAVLTNNTALWAIPHVLGAAFLVAGTFVCGIGTWWMVKSTRKHAENPEHPDRMMYRTAARFGALVIVIAFALVFHTGAEQGKLLFQQQPYKMAAAESLCTTEQPAGFSVLSVGHFGTTSCEEVNNIIVIPGLLSWLATGDWSAEVTGLTETQAAYEERYGTTTAEGETIVYQPNLLVTYWAFRAMIGFAFFSILLALTVFWVTRGKRTTGSTFVKRFALFTIPMPFLAASFGWIFTEMGRQPFVVAPNPTGNDQILLMTMFGNSASVSAGEVWTSIIGFGVLYAILGVFWFRLQKRYASEGAPVIAPPPDDSDDEADKPMSFAY